MSDITILGKVKLFIRREANELLLNARWPKLILLIAHIDSLLFHGNIYWGDASIAQNDFFFTLFFIHWWPKVYQFHWLGSVAKLSES